MKNLSLIINGVLVIAVAVLFFLHFKGTPSSNTSTSTITTKSGTTVSTSSAIAYVDLDSLEANYDYYKEKKADFEKNQRNLESSLNAGMESLQREAYEFQQKAQTMTQAEGEATQQRLMDKKNKLEQQRDNGAQNMQAEMTKFNAEVYSKIDTVLLDYNKDHKYAYILSYQKGGAILYTDKGLDITKEVVERLNKLGNPKK
jgi:outer membrane protein